MNDFADDDDSMSATPTGVVYDEKQHRAYHIDGDDNHSLASNQRLAAYNAVSTPPPPPPQVAAPVSVGRVLTLNEHANRLEDVVVVAPAVAAQPAVGTVEQRVVDVLDMLHADRDNAALLEACVKQVRREFNELVNEPPWEWLQRIDLADNAATEAAHTRLVRMHVGLNYALAMTRSSSGINGRLASDLSRMIGTVVDMEHVLLTMQNMLHRHQPGLQLRTAALTMNWDYYEYTEMASAHGKQSIIDLNIVESIVYKRLQNDGCAVMFDTGDGAGGFNYRTSPDRFEIYVLQRATYYGEDTVLEGVLTHFYGQVSRFDRYVHYVLSENIVGRQLSSGAIETFIKRQMASPDNMLRFCRRVVYDRNLMAFPTGVYVLSEDRFYSNAESLPRGQTLYERVPRIFHAADFDYDKFQRVTVDEQRDFCDDCEPAILDAIPTPALDRIFNAQHFPKAVRMFILALIGRHLHALHSLEEKLHMLPYLYGVAGTGKSTLCNIVQLIMRSCRTIARQSACIINNGFIPEFMMMMQHDDDDDTPMADRRKRPAAAAPTSTQYDRFATEIEAKVEENFPLQNAVGALAWTMSEVIAGTNFPRATLLKMAARDVISITLKNRTPHVMIWDLPGMLAGNTTFPFKDTQGEIERRLVVVWFEHMVEDRDGNLQRELELELGNIILKCNRVYLAWARWAADKDLYATARKPGALPSYFERTREMMMTQVSKPALFLHTYIEEGLLVYKPDDHSLTCSVAELLRHYRQFLQTQTLSSNNNNASANPSAARPSAGAAPPMALKNELESLLRRRKLRIDNGTVYGLVLKEPAAAAPARH